MNPEIIAHLENALSGAKNGDVTSIALIYRDQRGDHMAFGGDASAMIGALGICQATLISEAVKKFAVNVT